jgi:tetratricopeptide (TPR) repeat protein
MKSNIALAFNNRGHLKYLDVDFNGAVEDYENALKLDPILSSSYYNRGTIYYRMGET